jgi:hypothetical protein
MGTTYTVSSRNYPGFSCVNYNPSICAPWVTWHIHTVIKHVPESASYPITKFLHGHGQWWYINAVFNEPLKKETAWCKIWPREKVVVSICRTSDPALWKNTIEKHLYIHVKIGGELSPVVECNRHNWFSVGVTTSFPTCPEMGRQSQLVRWRKMGRVLFQGTQHRKCWLSESHAGALSVHVVALFPRYGHCVCVHLATDVECGFIGDQPLY